MNVQSIDVWPFINGAYGAAVLFVVGISFLTYRRYRRAQAQLTKALQLNAHT